MIKGQVHLKATEKLSSHPEILCSKTQVILYHESAYGEGHSTKTAQISISHNLLFADNYDEMFKLGLCHLCLLHWIIN